MINRLRLTRRAALALAAAACLATPALAEGETYRVGSTPTGVPFTFLNIETNEIDGLMVDIIKAIGAAEGFAPQVEATQWSALIPSLTSNKIDLIVAAMVATEERAKVVAFSDPVYAYGEGLVVRADNPASYATWEDLADKAVGVQVGTSYADGMQKSGIFSDMRIYDTMQDMMRDVALGRIEGAIGDYPIYVYQLEHGHPDLRLVEEYETQLAGNVAIAVRQGDTDLLATINSGLAAIKESGELDAIIAKWNLD